FQGAGVAAVVAGPLDAGVPGVLSQAPREALLAGGEGRGLEAAPPRGGAAAAVGGAGDGGADAQPQPVALADEGVRPASGAGECAAQVVAGRDGRREQDDPVEAVGRQALGRGEDDGTA